MVARTLDLYFSTSIFCTEASRILKTLTVFGNISSLEELEAFKQSIRKIKKEAKLDQYREELEELKQKEKELTRKIEEELEAPANADYSYSRSRGVIRGKITRTKRKLEKLTER